MSAENKWDNIRIAAVWFFCITGLVTCNGVDKYSAVQLQEAEARKAEAEANAAKARLELEKLHRQQTR